MEKTRLREFNDRGAMVSGYPFFEEEIEKSVAMTMQGTYFHTGIEFIDKDPDPVGRQCHIEIVNPPFEERLPDIFPTLKSFYFGPWDQPNSACFVYESAEEHLDYSNAVIAILFPSTEMWPSAGEESSSRTITIQTTSESKLLSSEVEYSVLYIQEETSKKISSNKAYELALNTLKAFDEEWSTYVKEEAKFLYALDVEEENDL